MSSSCVMNVGSKFESSWRVWVAATPRTTTAGSTIANRPMVIETPAEKLRGSRRESTIQRRKDVGEDHGDENPVEKRQDDQQRDRSSEQANDEQKPPRAGRVGTHRTAIRRGSVLRRAMRGTDRDHEVIGRY